MDPSNKNVSKNILFKNHESSLLYVAWSFVNSMRNLSISFCSGIAVTYQYLSVSDLRFIQN